jgi:hypothetical protein
MSFQMEILGQVIVPRKVKTVRCLLRRCFSGFEAAVVDLFLVFGICISHCHFDIGNSRYAESGIYNEDGTVFP